MWRCGAVLGEGVVPRPCPCRVVSFHARPSENTHASLLTHRNRSQIREDHGPRPGSYSEGQSFSAIVVEHPRSPRRWHEANAGALTTTIRQDTPVAAPQRRGRLERTARRSKVMDNRLERFVVRDHIMPRFWYDALCTRRPRV